MQINIVQAIILGLFASLSSMPGLGGTSIGNYTLGRPLVGGLICGIVLGDIPTGILVGCAMQVVYIALVTPGGTVSADVRAIPLPQKEPLWQLPSAPWSVPSVLSFSTAQQP